MAGISNDHILHQFVKVTKVFGSGSLIHLTFCPDGIHGQYGKCQFFTLMTLDVPFPLGALTESPSNGMEVMYTDEMLIIMQLDQWGGQRYTMFVRLNILFQKTKDIHGLPIDNFHLDQDENALFRKKDHTR